MLLYIVHTDKILGVYTSEKEANESMDYFFDFLTIPEGKGCSEALSMTEWEVEV